MASPFPGMDPYLEAPEHWRGFHHHLPEEIMTVLNAALSERYFAEVEIHTVLDVDEVGIAAVSTWPDAAVFEVNPAALGTSAPSSVLPAPVRREALLPEEVRLRTVTIRTTGSKTLVTAIEILSPYNKRGNGLEEYRLKRRRLLHTPVHLIEIDLLRSGSRPGWELATPPIQAEYIVLVNRAARQRTSEIWPVALNEPLPSIPVPLLPPDPDVVLVLQEVLANIYRRAAYARRIDYSQPVPPPALRPAMAKWWAAQRTG